MEKQLGTQKTQQHSVMQMQMQVEKANRAKQAESIIKKNATSASTQGQTVIIQNPAQQYKSLKDAQLIHSSHIGKSRDNSTSHTISSS